MVSPAEFKLSFCAGFMHRKSFETRDFIFVITELTGLNRARLTEARNASAATASERSGAVLILNIDLIGRTRNAPIRDERESLLIVRVCADSVW